MNYEQQRQAAFRELLQRLAATSDIPTAAAAEIATHAARHELLAVLFTGEPTRSPESWDVCVVLPELLAGRRGVAAIVLDPVESRVAAPAFGIDKLPALVILRDGEYTGVIEGMRDWDPFVSALDRLTSAAPCAPPVAGVYTTAPGAERPS